MKRLIVSSCGLLVGLSALAAAALAAEGDLRRPANADKRADVANAAAPDVTHADKTKGDGRTGGGDQSLGRSVSSATEGRVSAGKAAAMRARGNVARKTKLGRADGKLLKRQVTPAAVTAPKTTKSARKGADLKTPSAKSGRAASAAQGWGDTAEGSASHGRIATP